MHITATDTCKSLWTQQKLSLFQRNVELCQPDGKRQTQELFYGRREPFLTCHLSIFIPSCPFSIYPGMVNGLHTSPHPQYSVSITLY